MQINPQIQLEVVEGKTLVIVFIPETLALYKPVYILKHGVEKGAFRRIGSSDRHCTANDLDLLYQLRSGIPFESQVLSDVSWEDIDPAAVAAYRRRRSEVDPEAAELQLDDEGLLRALNCLVRRKGVNLPNVAGLLLFGTKMGLRRLLPMDARVDYVITEGPEWINNPSSRHYSTDYREPLITLLPRLHAQIMGDLPKLFGLKTGKLERTDTPIIPRDVIREALANSLMHRDYRAGQPTLVIRYSNRLEFKNTGYSLKPFEELGQPGSKQRNLIIAAVFHELNFAETKGTGITSMKKWMREAGLTTPPIIETDRDRNEFDLVLLPHHLLDQQDLEWLAQFKDYKLSDPELRALVVAREMRAITNQDYRQINGTDTLTASRALAHLRDLGLLLMKGSGTSTYYVLNDQLGTPDILPEKEMVSLESLHSNESAHTTDLSEGLSPHVSDLSGGITPYVNLLRKGSTPYVSPLHKGLDAIPTNFPELSEELKNEIIRLPRRCSIDKIKNIILSLCKLGPLQPVQLARILNRDYQYLRINYLSKMIHSGDLEYLFPEKPAHPHQAYIAPRELKE